MTADTFDEDYSNMEALGAPPAALAYFQARYRPGEKRRRGKPPKVSLERKREMADLAIDWYRREGAYLSRREYICVDATDANGNDVAGDETERNALKRHLRTDKDCQRRLNEIDGR